MKTKISSYPGSYLALELEKDERIITEKGAFMFCDGDYRLETKFETKSYKNWIAKLFGGKSLTYNIYIALEPLNLALSTKDNAELFVLDITDNNPILFEPDLHFARTMEVALQFHKTDWKSTLNDGIKLKASGNGKLFLKGYGCIIEQELNTEKAVLIDEDALIAFEEKLEVKTISKGVKELITSGEGFLYSIRGKGKIWLQAREKSEESGSGGVVDSIFGFLK